MNRSPRLSITEKMKIFSENFRLVKKHYEIPLNDVIEEAIDLYTVDVIEKMIERSLDLEEAKWRYNGRMGLFSNRNGIRLALVFPVNGITKYIHANSESGKEVIAALPREYHRDIVESIEEKGEKLHNISGGRIYSSKKSFSKPEIILYGTSVDYGPADHENVARKLSDYGLDVKFR